MGGDTSSTCGRPQREVASSHEESRDPLKRRRRHHPLIVKVFRYATDGEICIVTPPTIIATSDPTGTSPDHVDVTRPRIRGSSPGHRGPL